MVTFYATHDASALWNSGGAWAVDKEMFSKNIAAIAKRAIAARKGRRVGVREWNTRRSSVLRDTHG